MSKTGDSRRGGHRGQLWCQTAQLWLTSLYNLQIWENSLIIQVSVLIRMGIIWPLLWDKQNKIVCLFLLIILVSLIIVVQLLSCVWLFVIPWTAALQASPSFTTSWSLPKLMSTELVIPSNHLVLCHPLLLLPSIFPSIRVFSNELALCIRWPKF